MDIKFSKDSTEGQQAGADKKGSQNILLVVLLVLVCAFGYIYFFTGLIKPETEQKSAQAPVPQVEKKPLPSADGSPAQAGAGDAKKDATTTPDVKPEPAAAPAAAPAPVAAAKPAAKEAAEEAQIAVKKPLPGVGKADAKKPAPVEKKQPAVAENKPQPVKEVEKKPIEVKKPVEVKKPAEKAALPAVASVKVKKDVQKPAKKETVTAPATVAGSGNWTVLVGNYVLEEAMATDLARVRKAGLEAFIVPGAQKKSHMNRLLLAEFTDRDSAQAELAKLKRVTADAFMGDNAGMHVVYAGSYLLDTRAASEKERLAAAGFKLTVKRVEVSIPTKNLTAGSFAEKSAAEEVQKKLRVAGVKASLSRQ
ncbi:MAG: SPOR domain-containing protein [Geobacteraceae bacterium]|nr:SPOR domain-containing protein [Geobacteraceae bacterium]